MEVLYFHTFTPPLPCIYEVGTRSISRRWTFLRYDRAFPLARVRRFMASSSSDRLDPASSPTTSSGTEPTSTSPRASEEEIFEGISLSPGIAIGTAYLHARASDGVEVQTIDGDAVAEEVALFEEAVDRAEHDLSKIIALSREKLGEESTAIFEAQRMMLHDEELLEPVRRRIRQKHQNAGYAVKAVMEQHGRRLEASDDEYLRDRANDLADIQDRIIRQLRRGKLGTQVDEDTVVIAENLGAADVIRFNSRGIRGCVSARGGATSHVALIARALGLPAVAGISGIADRIPTEATVILDGLQGRLIVNPTAETVRFYRERQAHYRELLEGDEALAGLPAETQDGHRIQLLANVEFRQELNLIARYGAEGIGLLRTEMLFLMRRDISLSEALQYEVYRDIVEAVRPGVSTIRLLDLGGDKMAPLAHREHNPFLGWRGIRVLLDRPELLRPQLRALLRASAHGPLRILLPMITHRAEVLRFKEVLEAVRSELAAEGEPMADDVAVGVMVEVPAVALHPDPFAAEVDFFSIGTNDLTQYVLAIDRGNDLVADRYDALDPAVLSLIKRTVDAAHAHGIPVSLCGEVGSDPTAIPILVGLGLDQISASPTYLPSLKRVVRALHLAEARSLAECALRASDAGAVRTLNTDWLRKHVPEALELEDSEWGSSGASPVANA